MKLKSRDKEANLIRNANRAAAVGRLLMRGLNDWEDFLRVETEELNELPRRALKSGKADIRERLSKEISGFCQQNFEGMNQDKLVKLYARIKSRRGLELSLEEFERDYAKIKTKVLKGVSEHCTVSISLDGLQFKFPEDMFSKDIIYAVEQLRSLDSSISKLLDSARRDRRRAKPDLIEFSRKHDAYSRMCLLACCNLLESFLNGLAWSFSRDAERMAGLSKRKQDKLADKNATIRDKLLKYPEILSGQQLWHEADELPNKFLNEVKPFRDSLVHASPFSEPERYGGRDKLEHIYRLDMGIALDSVSTCILIMVTIFGHINGETATCPSWLDELESCCFQEHDRSS